MTTPLFLLRCLQAGLSVSDLDLITVGLVFDMYTESANDECKDAWTQLADQADFDSF